MYVLVHIIININENEKFMSNVIQTYYEMKNYPPPQKKKKLISPIIIIRFSRENLLKKEQFSGKMTLNIDIIMKMVFNLYFMQLQLVLYYMVIQANTVGRVLSGIRILGHGFSKK